MTVIKFRFYWQTKQPPYFTQANVAGSTMGISDRSYKTIDPTVRAINYIDPISEESKSSPLSNPMSIVVDNPHEATFFFDGYTPDVGKNEYAFVDFDFYLWGTQYLDFSGVGWVFTLDSEKVLDSVGKFVINYWEQKAGRVLVRATVKAVIAQVNAKFRAQLVCRFGPAVDTKQTFDGVFNIRVSVQSLVPQEVPRDDCTGWELVSV